MYFTCPLKSPLTSRVSEYYFNRLGAQALRIPCKTPREIWEPVLGVRGEVQVAYPDGVRT